MNQNVEKLDAWEEVIKDFNKIRLKDAKNLYNNIINTTDRNERARLREELITGTLYLPFKFLKKSYLMYVNGSNYDFDDVINSANKIWIDLIDSGRLLKVHSYSMLLRGGFHNALERELGIADERVTKLTDCTLGTFDQVSDWYLKNRINGHDINYQDFLEFVEKAKLSNGNFRSLNVIKTFHLLQDMFANIPNDNDYFDESTKPSMEDLKSMRNFLVDKSLTVNIDDNRDDIASFDELDAILDSMVGRQIHDTIFNDNKCRLKYRQRRILEEYFGIVDGIEHSQREIGDEMGLSSANVSSIQRKALLKVRDQAGHNPRFKDMCDNYDGTKMK